MSTHRRAWMVRTGVIATVVVAGLFGLAAPAMADNPTVTITSLSSGSLQVGESATLKYTVKNNNKLPDGESQTTVKVSFSGFQSNEISCQGSCDFTQVIVPGQTSSEFSATIKAGNVPAGQTRNGSIHIKVTIGNANTDAPRDISVQGPTVTQPPAPTTVPEVSGTVVDSTNNQAVVGAKVSIQDSAAKTWSVGTDTAGKYKITSTQDNPIKPGTIAFMVEKDGFQPFTLTKQANANQPLTGVRLAVTPAATTPTATAAAGGPTADPNTTGAGISPIETAANVTPASGSGGGLSWLLIAVGAILVALGVGAIVLLFVRKKDEQDPDGQDPNMPRRGGPPGQQGPPPGRGGPRPPQRRGPGDVGPPMRSGPGPDPTRQMRPPVSPGPRGDQTMISPSPLANAPTQLHGRIPDQTDPYGAPPPRNGGQPGYGQNPYGAAGGGAHGASATSAYPGAAPSYGQGPDQYGQQGYGQGPGTDPYGPQQGYGQPGHNGQEGYNPAHGGGHEPRGQRPGPAQPPAQPDPRRVDWLDD